MFGLDDAISNTIVGTIGKVLDRVLPDDKAKAEAQLELAKLQQSGELQELTIRMSAIVEEAKSQDPWTSRARPAFLYVIYVMILFAIPMGVLTIFNPQAATTLIAGFKEWLNAIPNVLYELFGAGYLGYCGARSWDKNSRKKNK
jgi:hypothetical protein